MPLDGWEAFLRPDDFENTAKAFFQSIQTRGIVQPSRECMNRQNATWRLWIIFPADTNRRQRYMPDKRTELVGFPGMTDSLQISVHSDEEGAVMYLRGRLSIESSPDLRDHLLAMLRRQPPPETIAIDLAEVSYVDTSGIATLIEGLKIARIGGIAMRLHGLQGRLLHLFQATGIGSLFDTDGPTNNLSTTTVC
jgi:anti-sigma B factor antagonist